MDSAIAHEAPRLLDLVAEARRRAPRVPALSEGLRRAAQATWRGRMINEHESAAVFEGLAPQLRAAGAPERRVIECAKMAEEERLHGALCGAVLEALGGEARAIVPSPALLPAHEDVERLEAALRNVLSVCCLSETVAVALINAERLDMPEGEVRSLLTRILADEVGHARFGWTWLAEVSSGLTADVRARLGAYLAVAFAHLEQHELAHLRGSTPFSSEAAAIGVCSGEDARALFYETVSAVIVPRLEAHGLPAERAWRERICSS
jgi:hypothetical protein